MERGLGLCCHPYYAAGVVKFSSTESRMVWVDFQCPGSDALAKCVASAQRTVT